MLYKVFTLIFVSVLMLVAGSRFEIALQQADLTPKICVAEQQVYVDSQAVKEFKAGK